MSNEITVFLADDHAMVRQGLASLLDQDGNFTIVGQCGNGLEVVGQVVEARPQVVVLDIMMPGLNGLDICRELTRKAKSVAILMLSMCEDEQFVARALEYGASGYLLKDAVGEQLAEAIQAVAQGQLYLGQGISRNVLNHLAEGDPYESLTNRERQVLQCIAEGMTNRQIAERLGLAIKTVDTHRMRLMRKLDIHDQTALVKFAVRRGMVQP